MKKIITKISILLLTITSGFAQGVINSEKLFNAEVEKIYFIISPTIDIQSGNSEIFETGMQFSSLYKVTKRHWLKGTAGVDIIREGGEDVSNDKFLQLRHTFSIKKWIHTFTFYQLQNSFSLGVNKRELFGSGLRLKLLKKEEVALDIGLGIMNESEEYNFEIPFAKKIRITSMMIFKKNINSVEFKNITYYQPNISNVWDFRLLNELDLTFSINEWLDYEVNYIIRYDNEQPSFLDKKLDQYITSGFNIKFTK